MRELEHLLSRSVLKALGRHLQRPRILSLEARDLGLPVDAASASLLQVEPAVAAPLSPGVASPQSGSPGLRETLQAFERRLVLETLEANDFNGAAAARALGLDRGNLSRLAKRLGVSMQTKESRA